jgi:hypothetical protein
VEAWQAASLFALMALVLGSVLYFVVGTEALRDAWEILKEMQAARRAEHQAQLEARIREREVGVEVGLSPAAVLDRARWRR